MKTRKIYKYFEIKERKQVTMKKEKKQKNNDRNQEKEGRMELGRKGKKI